MSTTLGQRIAMLRKQKNLTQEALAESLGVSAQAVSKWENDISCPDIMLLPQLAKLLGATVDKLLTGDSAPETRMAPPAEVKQPDQQILRILCISSDGDKVRVNLPMKLITAAVEMGMGMDSISIGKSEAFSKVDFTQVLSLANMGVVGKLVEIEGADGDKVEVWVE